ncbi:hypothetical protein CHLRE_01g040801v5 [Chlamydomonas reinhardtii]|uniref:Uncharacterized protein n=1 Tax=Chlamydomonas reinhardtii TaxID=3055 RepID=A0A2K3E7D1_CHLRE|nr:uncharacterized protein CHLRE_01g040801v5 [Chlamydomonas reinhardtii]PNW88699.1 hypothetical protein CHLRE_01g040801v5 [Chlamydomonas reinhardtii]
MGAPRPLRGPGHANHRQLPARADAFPSPPHRRAALQLLQQRRAQRARRHVTRLRGGVHWRTHSGPIRQRAAATRGRTGHEWRESARPGTSAAVGSSGYGPGNSLSHTGTSASIGLMSPGTPQAGVSRDGPSSYAQQPHLTSSFSPQSTYNLVPSPGAAGGGLDPSHPHGDVVDRSLRSPGYAPGTGGGQSFMVGEHSRVVFHANVPDLAECSGVGMGAAEASNPAESGLEGGPGGSMTVSFEIGHRSHRVAS